MTASHRFSNTNEVCGTYFSSQVNATVAVSRSRDCEHCFYGYEIGTSPNCAITPITIGERSQKD